MDNGVLDDIIRRLLEGKGGKQVQLSEGEIRQLCINSRQIFLSQPNLLEIRAPVRICGRFSFLSLILSVDSATNGLFDHVMFRMCNFVLMFLEFWVPEY